MPLEIGDTTRNRVLNYENNCYAFDHILNECSALSKALMTGEDLDKCGTLKCPFYKPVEHINDIKHIASGGSVTFESKDDYYQRTGYDFIDIDELTIYKHYPHTPDTEVTKLFDKYMKLKKETGKEPEFPL